MALDKPKGFSERPDYPLSESDPIEALEISGRCLEFLRFLDSPNMPMKTVADVRRLASNEKELKVLVHNFNSSNQLSNSIPEGIRHALERRDEDLKKGY
jgi:hypothetical protein